MTFEEWFQGRLDADFMDKESARKAFEWAWNAAKEDSKPVAKIIERRLFGMEISEYSIIGFDGFESAIRNTKEAAEQWALENGYRLK